MIFKNAKINAFRTWGLPLTMLVWALWCLVQPESYSSAKQAKYLPESDWCLA